MISTDFPLSADRRALLDDDHSLSPSSTDRAAPYYKLETRSSALIGRRLAEVSNRLIALFRAALTIALRFTTWDTEHTSWITNCAHVLVNAIGWFLRDRLMVAPTSDRPTAQRNRMMAEIRRLCLTCILPICIGRFCLECALNCKSCNIMGAGKCDQCTAGYAYNFDTHECVGE